MTCSFLKSSCYTLYFGLAVLTVAAHADTRACVLSDIQETGTYLADLNSSIALIATNLVVSNGQVGKVLELSNARGTAVLKPIQNLEFGQDEALELSGDLRGTILVAQLQNRLFGHVILVLYDTRRIPYTVVGEASADAGSMKVLSSGEAGLVVVATVKHLDVYQYSIVSGQLLFQGSIAYPTGLPVNAVKLDVIEAADDLLSCNVQSGNQTHLLLFNMGQNGLKDIGRFSIEANSTVAALNATVLLVAHPSNSSISALVYDQARHSVRLLEAPVLPRNTPRLSGIAAGDNYMLWYAVNDILKRPGVVHVFNMTAGLTHPVTAGVLELDLQGLKTNEIERILLNSHRVVVQYTMEGQTGLTALSCDPLPPPPPPPPPPRCDRTRFKGCISGTDQPDTCRDISVFKDRKTEHDCLVACSNDPKCHTWEFCTTSPVFGDFFCTLRGECSLRIDPSCSCVSALC